MTTLSITQISKLYTVYIQDCNHYIGRNSMEGGMVHSWVVHERTLQTVQLLSINEPLTLLVPKLIHPQ